MRKDRIDHPRFRSFLRRVTLKMQQYAPAGWFPRAHIAPSLWGKYINHWFSAFWRTASSRVLENISATITHPKRFYFFLRSNYKIAKHKGDHDKLRVVAELLNQKFKIEATCLAKQEMKGILLINDQVLHVCVWSEDFDRWIVNCRECCHYFFVPGIPVGNSSGLTLWRWCMPLRHAKQADPWKLKMDRIWRRLFWRSPP